MGARPPKCVGSDLSLNKPGLKSGEKEREVTGPWPFALWMRP